MSNKCFINRYFDFISKLSNKWILKQDLQTCGVKMFTQMRPPLLKYLWLLFTWLFCTIACDDTSTSEFTHGIFFITLVPTGSLSYHGDDSISTSVSFSSILRMVYQIWAEPCEQPHFNCLHQIVTGACEGQESSNAVYASLCISVGGFLVTSEI